MLHSHFFFSAADDDVDVKGTRHWRKTRRKGRTITMGDKQINTNTNENNSCPTLSFILFFENQLANMHNIT